MRSFAIMEMRNIKSITVTVVHTPLGHFPLLLSTRTVRLVTRSHDATTKITCSACHTPAKVCYKHKIKSLSKKQ